MQIQHTTTPYNVMSTFIRSSFFRCHNRLLLSTSTSSIHTKRQLFNGATLSTQPPQHFNRRSTNQRQTQATIKAKLKKSKPQANEESKTNNNNNNNSSSSFLMLPKKHERLLKSIWAIVLFTAPLFLLWDESQDIERVVRAIEQGSIVEHGDQLLIAPVRLIDRSRSIGTVKEIIQPKEQKGPVMTTFCIITGATGSGKTTLIEQVAKEMNQRFIFIQFDNKGSYTRDHIVQVYAKALNYHPLMNEEDLPFWKPFIYKLQSTVSRKSKTNILSVMKRACTVIQERDLERQQADPDYSPCIPVFCFDNINALVDKNQELLLDQFEASKDATDKRLYASIYTLNDAKTYYILQNEEAFSRVNQQLEVRDVPLDTVRQYMKQEMTMGGDCTERDVDTLVDHYCGGHLLSVQNLIYLRNSRGLSAQQLMAVDLHKVRMTMSNYNMERRHPTRYAIAVWNLCQRLYGSETGSITEDEAKEAIQDEIDKESINMKMKEQLVDEILLDLIMKKIVSRDLLSNSIRFHRNTVRTFVREELATLQARESESGGGGPSSTS